MQKEKTPTAPVAKLLAACLRTAVTGRQSRNATTRLLWRWVQKGRAAHLTTLMDLTHINFIRGLLKMGILEDVTKTLDRIPNWKRIQSAPKDLDALELRVKALEVKLTPATGAKCPGCGAMALKLIRSSPSPEPWGSMGARQDHFACGSCSYTDIRERDPG